MKKAIVVGGAGFVGNAIVRELLANGVEVTVVERPGFLSAPTKGRLAGQDVRIVECDISESQSLLTLIPERGFDAYFYFAWTDLFGPGLTDYIEQISNLRWTVDAVNTAADLGCKTFVGAGSISQYELLYEKDHANPEDKHRVYKTAKLACQYMGDSVAAQKGITFCWPIITNVFGPGEKTPRLVNSMIRRLQAGQRQSLSEGSQLYDFIYIDDAALALRLIGEKGKSGRVYTLASGNVQPLRNFLMELRDIVAPNAELGFGEMPFNGINLPVELYSIEALQQDTGFAPQVSFAEAIRRTATFLQNEEK